MNEIWTTGITVKNNEDGWAAECNWQYGKFGKEGRMEGTIATRYFEKTLSESIDYVLECMKRMGVKRSDEIEEMNDLGFDLYYEDDNIDKLKEDAKKEIKDEANKRGWKYYIE